jgi:glutathione S-transferase
MSDIIIYGIPLSPHVRAARMAAIEKGISHTVEMADFEDMKTPEHFAVYPFGRIPAMRHGENVIWETQAICRYIDEAFEGPALMPADPLGRAHVEQWLSAANDYFANTMLSRYAAKYILAQIQETEPDHQAIEEAIPAIEELLEKIDHALKDKTYFVNDTLTLADLRVMALIDGIRDIPRSAPLFETVPNITRVLEAHGERRSFSETKLPWPFGEVKAA